MSHQEKIFVVVNPTIDKQVALDRALITSQLMTPKPEICVFVAVDSNTVNLDARNLIFIEIPIGLNNKFTSH